MENINDDNEALKERLREAEETLDAIREGQIDALVVKGREGQQLYSVVSAEHPYQVFFQNMSEAAVILSAENIILYANRSFFELLEAPSETVIGTSILAFLKEEDRPYFIDCTVKKMKKKSEIAFLTKQGKKRSVYISVFNGVWNEVETTCVLLGDFTQFKEIQRYLETSESIARMFSAAPNLTVASNSIIKMLNKLLGWEVLVIWLWNKEKQVLQCFEIAHIEGIDIEKFKAKTRAMQCNSNELFSHACLSNRPIWIKDISEEYSFLRRNEAAEIGLRGALGFPFNQDSELGGVIELFRRAPFDENVDNLMLELISSFGVALGIYIHRLMSEQKAQEFGRALELSFDSTYKVDRNCCVVKWSAGAEKMYGWTALEMIGSNITRLYPKENKDEFSLVFDSLLSDKEIEKTPSKRIRKDGKQLVVDSVYEKNYDFLGNLLGVFVVEQDKTHERELAEELSFTVEKFNSFIEITGDWIWELDTNANFVFSNVNSSVMLGYPSNEVVGKSLFYFLSFIDRDKIEKQIEQIIERKEKGPSVLISFLHKNGANRWLENNITPLLNSKGELLGLRGASRDVTESKNLEKVKNEFVSVVSHELRTPLTSIYGALSLITSKEMSHEEMQSLITIAHKNSIRLTNLINDITDIQKLQLGKIEFDFKEINLVEVVTEAISTAKIVADKANIKIRTAVHLPVIKIEGDYQRLLQVMNNLLSNAIKFSPPGEFIDISMEVFEESCKVSVQDRGPGISREFQSKIFTSFSQADSSSKRPLSGAGLGLYISKFIIDSHRGKIQYTTQEGEGATFYFTLPLLKKHQA